MHQARSRSARRTTAAAGRRPVPPPRPRSWLCPRRRQCQRSERERLCGRRRSGRRVGDGWHLSDPTGGLRVPAHARCLRVRWLLPQDGLRGERRLLSGDPRALTWGDSPAPSPRARCFNIRGRSYRLARSRGTRDAVPRSTRPPGSLRLGPRSRYSRRYRCYGSGESSATVRDGASHRKNPNEVGDVYSNPIRGCFGSEGL
jgi:hypothetical protein